MNNELTILMVEDNDGHARLIEKNLRRAGIGNSIIHLNDGGKAIDYLFRQGEYKDNKISPEQLLVLLDLNMPVMDGYQVLEKIKSNSFIARIPVILLTTTEDRREVERCYDLGCNVYITKPVEYEQFAQAIRDLGLLLTVVKAPEIKLSGE